MTELASLTIALLIAFMGSGIAERFGYPRILGQLVASFFLAIPIVQGLFSERSVDAISLFSELGIIFLLLLTGFEMNLADFKKNRRNAGIIALFGAIIPFSLAFLLGKFFFGLDTSASLILGMCLAVTAEGTTVALLVETKTLQTKLGNIILGAGILDDFFEVFFLAILLFLANHDSGSGTDFFTSLGKIFGFLALLWVAFHFLPRFFRKKLNHTEEIPLLTTMIVIGLSLAVFSEFSGLGSVFGAFVAGVLLQKSFLGKKKATESKDLELLVFGFIVPFFFINIGMHFDFSSLFQNPEMLIAVFVTALVGKVLGAILTKPFVDLSFSQLHLIGWGMNSRGVMELVLAQIAFSADLISADLYSAIVFMAIVTTLIFPFVFKKILEKNPTIMEE